MASFADPSQYEERIQQLPFTVPTIALAVLGIVGNAHALHIVRKYYGSISSYTIILKYLVIIDLTGCVGMLGMEVRVRLENPLTFPQRNGWLFAKLSYYIGHIIATWSMWLVVLTGYERYRAICFPLRVPPSTRKVHLSCLGLGCVSLFTAAPAIFLYGVRSFSLPDFPNGSEAGIKDSMKSSYLPSIYYAVLTAIFIGMVVIVGWFYHNIRVTLREARKTKRTLMEDVYVKEKYDSLYYTKAWNETSHPGSETKEQDHFTATTENSTTNLTITVETSIDKSQTSELTMGQTKQKSSRSVYVLSNHPHVEVEHNSSDQLEKRTAHGNGRIEDSSNESIQTILNNGERNVAKNSKGLAQLQEKIDQQDAVKKMRDSSSKTTKTALAVTILSFCCYTPMVVSLSVQAWPSPTSETEITRAELYTFRYLFVTVFINNVFNPAIYFWNDTRFRSGLRKMYSRK